MDDLAVLVPSRARPGSIARLVGAWAATGATAELVVYVDDDDPELAGYEALSGCRLEIGPRRRLCASLNHLAAQWAPQVPFVGFMGDDHLPKTPGWDVAVRDALRGLRSGLCYGNDLLQGARLPTAIFMTSSVPLALGFMGPPDQTHLYLDNFWLDLGQSWGRFSYLPDVVIEHLHPAAGKASMDASYQETNSASTDLADRVAFQAFRDDGRFDAALAKVRALP